MKSDELEHRRMNVELSPFSSVEDGDGLAVLEISSLATGVKNPKIIVDIFAISDFLARSIPAEKYPDFRLRLSLKNSREPLGPGRKNSSGCWMMPYLGGLSIYLRANFHLADRSQLLMINRVLAHELVHVEQWYQHRAEAFGPNITGYWEKHHNVWIGSNQFQDQACAREYNYEYKLSIGEEVAFLLYLPGCFEYQFPIDPELAGIYWPELPTFRFAEEMN